MTRGDAVEALTAERYGPPIRPVSGSEPDGGQPLPPVSGAAAQHHRQTLLHALRGWTPPDRPT